MTRIVVVTCGRPCGPCCGRRRFMLLRKASMLIAVFEFFTGSAILAGSLGSLAATGLNRQELVPDNYSQAEYEQLCLSHAWHAVCSIILIAFSIVLVFGYLNRNKRCLIAYIAGVIFGHVLHLVGLYFSFFLAPVYDAIIVLTFLRAYFVWIIYCLLLEVKMYPEGFPPPQRNFTEPDYNLPGPAVSEASTLRILGDG